MNIKSIGLFCLLTLSSSTFPIASFARKALHWGIAAGPLWVESALRATSESDQFRQMILPLLEDVSLESQDFIKKELESSGLSNYQNISIKILPDNPGYTSILKNSYNYYVTHFNIIFLGNDTAVEMLQN